MTLRLRSVLVATSSFAIWGAAACGSETTSEQPPNNGGDAFADVSTDASTEQPPNNGGDAFADVSADASIEVLPADTEKVIATAKGGMPPSPQSDASTCRSADNTFTLVPSSRQLTWKSCSRVETDGGEDPGPWEFVEGQKVLTEAEAAPLVAALRALEPSSRQKCGADKPTLTVNVTTSHGTETYRDDFYACAKLGNYVTGMDAVFEELERARRRP